MKKLNVAAIVVAGLLMAGWTFRGAVNRPKSVVVNAATTTVPVAFSSGSGSLVLQNLNGSQYQHLMVINEAKSPISVLTIPEVSLAPAASVTGQRLHVVSSGIAAYDDVSIFGNLYIQSEDNAIGAGLIKIMVW